MAEKYDFQRAYCDSCAALDETHEAEDYNTALKRFVTTINNICIEMKKMWREYSNSSSWRNA